MFQKVVSNLHLQYHFQNSWLQYATISDPFPQDIISKVDANRDKKISATEIIERCFDKIDADQDGKISKEDFVNACSNSKEILTLLAPIQD